MPHRVAVAALLLGAGVTVYGGVLARAEPSGPPHPPRITLEPADSDDEAQAPDTVHGVVRSGDEPLPGVRVELTPLFDGGEERTTRTDADGRFRFADVAVTPGTPYVAEAHYDDQVFASDVLRLGRAPDDPVRIVVAETTTRTSDLVIDVESIALVGDETGVQAVHTLTLRNRGARAYAGELRLPLLPGANAIDPRAGLDRRHLELEEGVMVSRSPLAPGRHDITYTYVAPIPRTGLALRHRSRYPTSRFELLTGGELEAVELDGLSAAGSIELGPRDVARSYRRYIARALGRGETVAATVVVGGDTGILRIAGLVAAVLLAGSLVAFPLMRRRRVLVPPTHEPVRVE